MSSLYEKSNNFIKLTKIRITTTATNDEDDVDYGDTGDGAGIEELGVGVLKGVCAEWASTSAR